MTIIPPISSVSAGVTPLSGIRSTGPSGEVSAAGGQQFGNALTSALDNLDAAHKNTDSLARAAATGDLNRIEDLMVATTESQLSTQLTVAFRNKAVESFNEIMRMQL